MSELQGPIAQAEADSKMEPAGRRSREKASRFALLGMLSFGGKRSGYDLKKAIASSTASFWSESYGNIYPRLRELVEEGLIRPQTSGKANTGRQKQLYSITAKGRKTLNAWLSEPVKARHEDNEFLLKLFFGSRVPVQSAIELVEANRAHHERLLRQFAISVQNILDGPLSHEEKTYFRLTVDYGRAVSKALVGWANQAESILRKLPSTSLNG